MDNLILFTHMYPFGNHETFLETEVNYLAAEFKTICILPAWMNDQQRDLPCNVIVDTGSSRKMNGKVQRFFSSWFQIEYRLLFKEIQQNPALFLRSGKALWRVLIYLEEASRVLRWLRNPMNQEKYPIRNTLFYTYWLRGQALGASQFASEAGSEAVLISRAHGGDIYEERHRPPYLPFRREIFQSMTAVFPVSADGSHYLQEHYPLTEGKIKISRLGVENPGFLTSASSDGVFRIVSCSSIIPVKRLNLLIAGISAYAHKHSGRQIEWVHLGSGPLIDQMKALAASSFPKNATWSFRGQIPNQEVLDYYRENPLDVFINVSASEGIPVSIMEALSCGIPVLAPAVGGIPEIINEEVGFLLVKDLTPFDIAEGLEKIEKSNPSKRKATRTHWSQNYNARENYRRFIQQIKSL